MVPVLAEIIRHHHIVVRASGIDRGSNFSLWPRIAVLIYFNVCSVEEGRVGIDLEPQHFPLGKYGTFTVEWRLMVRLHIFDERFQVLGCWFCAYPRSPKQGTEQRNNGYVDCPEVSFHPATFLVRQILTCQASLEISRFF